MVWINEGFVLNDSGTLVATTYIDLRKDGERTAIPVLVKGCKREYALEEGENILISKPARFRQYGEALILDRQEGLAKDETVTLTEVTAAQARRQRAGADLNEAREISNSRMRMVQSESYSSSDTDSKSLGYGKEWWIFSTSIKPPDEERETWRATLPDEYDHVSEIGHPAKFAQALAHMVVEQIGPKGKDGWLRDTTEGAEGPRTNHKLQWVMHGPVVYTDQVYDELTRDLDERTRVAAYVFTKSTEYAAQREYRFAVLNEGAEEETVLLKISGMMRDALKPAEGGLLRTPPTETGPGKVDHKEFESPLTADVGPTLRWTTRTERLTEREQTLWETRTPDGQVVSSEGEHREKISERIVTQEDQPEDEGLEGDVRIDWHNDGAAEKESWPALPSGIVARDSEQSDEEAAEELALEESEWHQNSRRGSLTIPVVQRGTGRVYKSLEEAFSDPAFPTSPAQESWQEKACNPEEIRRAYGAIDSLNWEMAYIKEEFRQDIASAGWYAMQCLRNIYARLGDVVDSVWIERERFVVIRFKETNEKNATGRIVITPSGAYAYCLQVPGEETSGTGGIEWGTMIFPIGRQLESFETYGWPKKTA